MFKNNICFLKLTVDISTADCESCLPGTIFLRGPVVVMLVVLIPDDVQGISADAVDKAYMVLTVQPRIATGTLSFIELPTGMIDGNSNFAGVAVKEIEEELIMVIIQTKLPCLTDKVGEIRRGHSATNDAGSDNESKPNLAGAEKIPFRIYPSAGWLRRVHQDLLTCEASAEEHACMSVRASMAGCAMRAR